MKKHITFILFDTDAASGIFSNELVFAFENTLLVTQLHSDSIIFYLKVPKKQESEHHQIYRYDRSDAENGNTQSPVKRNYNFKDYISLRRCITFLKEQVWEKNSKEEDYRWYFICIGHGYGYTFFDYDNEPGNERSAYDNILYAPELANSFKSVRLTLSLFNTCNFLMLENCRYFSTVTKYLIGTENYTSIKFLDLANYITLLNKRIETNEDSYHFLLKLYTGLLEKRDEIISNDPNDSERLKGASIFMLNLVSHFHNIFAEFNRVAYRLIKIYLESYEDWYKDFRKSQVQNEMDYVDMLRCIQSLHLLFPDDKEFLNSYLIIRDEMAAIRCQKDLINLNNENELNGISIYLPQFDRNLDFHYSRFRKKFPYLFDDLEWNFFVDRIVYKMANKKVLKK